LAIRRFASRIFQSKRRALALQLLNFTKFPRDNIHSVAPTFSRAPLATGKGRLVRIGMWHTAKSQGIADGDVFMKMKTVVTAAVVAVLALGLAAGGLWLSQRAAAQEDQEAPGQEKTEPGRPSLVNVTKAWFARSTPEQIKAFESAVDPGLYLTEENIKGLKLVTVEVVDAKPRPLAPQIGTLNYDPESMFLIKCRFAGELVYLAQRDDKIIKDGYEKTIKRHLKFGDKVKQGEVLAVFWSVVLGTAKAAFVDAISAVRLSQETFDRQQILYNEGALPLAALEIAKRQLRGDNNNLLTAERTLRMYKMTDTEIEDLRREAYEIIDTWLFAPNGRISKIDDTSLTLMLNKGDKESKLYRFAKECKFYQAIKKDDKEDKQEIKGGVKADIFQKLGKKGLGATVVTNDKGEVTELIVKKERDVVDEVNRWARTEVYVPWFDKAHPDRELTVVEKNTHIGDFVDNTNFGTWLFRVADLSRLQIWVHPPEEFLPRIRDGMKENGGLTWDVRIQSEPGAKHVERVDLIAPSLEPNQHNPMVVGYLPNKDHKYLVGQFVTATIDMPPEENTLEIPTTAINEYNGQSFVFVKDKNKPGEYCIRRVAVVGRYADYTVIRSKLRDQDKKFSADEVKQGRYPLRTLERGDQVVTRGVVELTTALENLLTKKSIELQQ
jgi:multidrug efflux pump subunit AcrA (membrane-fusion protein)